MILVAGYCNNNSQAQQRGFSLLEMLIVILVVGLLYSFAGSMLTLSVTDPLNAEVDRLRERIQLAQDETVVRSQAFALGFYSNGYTFYTQDDTQQWQPLAKDDLLGKHNFNGDFTQTLILQGQAVALPSEQAVRPQIFLLPTGEMQGFEWRLREGAKRESNLKFDNNGRLQDVATVAN